MTTNKIVKKKSNASKIPNRDIIQKKIKDLGYDLGCYHNEVNDLTKKELKKVLDALDQEYTDVDVIIKKRLYVVEISTVDNEKDVQILTQAEYISRYGDERWDEEE